MLSSQWLLCYKMLEEVQGVLSSLQGIITFSHVLLHFLSSLLHYCSSYATSVHRQNTNSRMQSRYFVGC